MRYVTSAALRAALEHRLLLQANESHISLDRLRRRVVFERVATRLETAEPGRWVIKGGMALECRLRNDARLTKDLDLGLRDAIADGGALHERLLAALSTDPDGDTFTFICRPPVQLSIDGAGAPTWRTGVTSRLGGKEFGGIQLDVSPRSHELVATERITLPNSLEFAGVAPREVEIIDIHRHAAEKFHGMLRKFGGRENTRVRDLADLVLLMEHGLLDPATTKVAVRAVWLERDGTDPPVELPTLPASWPARYADLLVGLDLNAADLGAARALVAEHWTQMQQSKEI